MQNNPIVTFREALASAGVILHQSETIRADGVLHRARSADDKTGKASCWYRLHLDAPVAGAGGDWRQGLSVRWSSKRESSLTTKERAEIAKRITDGRERAQAEQEARHRNASERAAKILADSAPAKPNHPYLLKKCITPGIARQSGPSLVLPVVDFTGKLWGLQFIQPDGSKRFLPGMKKSGHFIPSGGTPSPDHPLWIAEGHATACTLSALQPGVVVIAACDAGNLLSVAQAARAKWPGLVIVICPDFDRVGREKAQQAAISARCLILPPPAVVLPHCTDWNDIQTARRQGGVSC